PTGETVVVGSANGDFAVARYTVHGVLDTDFDRDGRATTDIADIADIDDSANALALAPDGTIYAAGTAAGHIRARHHFGPPVNAPSDLFLEQQDFGGDVQLRWTNNAYDETAIRVERAESLDGPWITRTTLDAVSPFSDEYNDFVNQLVLGTPYYYRVTAIR